VIPLSSLGEIAARSSIWETAPIGPEQPDYFNAVVVLETVLGPVPLLEHCLLIEQEMGRERRERWGPRIIDIDLLLYADAQLDIPGLTIPHPRMYDRRFVLEPLAEAWPRVDIPGHGRVEDLLDAVTDQVVERTDLEW
jgi:2-amino-4-hydroxy-6-hydroxymethyldihydropteridine diphosphokinase